MSSSFIAVPTILSSRPSASIISVVACDMEMARLGAFSTEAVTSFPSSVSVHVTG